MTSTVAAAQSTRASPAVWIGLLGVGLLLLLLAFSSQDSVNLGGRADPRGAGPEGMLAARLFIEEADGSVELDVYVPSEDIDVAILPRAEFPGFEDAPFQVESDDRRIIESWDPLLAWVENGGVLITEQDVPGGPTALTRQQNLDGLETIDPGVCSLPTLETVESVAPRSYVPVEVTPRNWSCFGTDSEALVSTATVGAGQIVRIATLEPFFNRSFGEANNGALFARMIVIDSSPRIGFVPEAPIFFIEDPDGEFAIDQPVESGDAEEEFAEGDDDSDIITDDGDPLAGDGGVAGPGDELAGPTRGDPVGRTGGGQDGLFQLIPQSVLAFLAGLVGAAVVYAYAKSRRLGSPVEEQIPIHLPGSSFVDALGRLYQRAENPTGRSASIMRNHFRTTLTRRSGMAADTPVDQIVETLSGPEQKAAVQRLLGGPDPANDDQLVDLARDLAEARQRVDQYGVTTLLADHAEPDSPVLTSKGTSQ